MFIEGGALKGKIIEYEFEISHVDSHIGDLKIENLNMLVQTVMKLGIPQINNMLGEGITIPKVMGISLGESAIGIHDEYIQIETSPKVAGPRLFKYLQDTLGDYLSESAGMLKIKNILNQQCENLILTALRI